MGILFLYDRGSAQAEVRAEIKEQLFSRENILILGTMPGEIYSAYEEAADRVQSDWLSQTILLAILQVRQAASVIGDHIDFLPCTPGEIRNLHRHALVLNGFFRKLNEG